MISHNDSIKEVVLYDIARKAKSLEGYILPQLRQNPNIARCDYKKFIQMAIIGWFHENARFN